MKTVLAFGCFEILHLGHRRYLEKARELGSRLVVVVARDSTMKRVKGREPVFDEKARLEMVRSMKPVDKAVLGHEKGEKYSIIGELKPDVIALGYDQREDEAKLRRWLDGNEMKKTRVVRIKHVENEEVYKSSKALEKLRRCITADL